VEGNGRLLRNTSAIDNVTGLWFVGNDNTMYNGAAIRNSGVGILAQGQGNTITDADAVANGAHGIHVIGDLNRVLRNDVGDRGKGNGGDGLHVSGGGNLVQENDAFANLGDGIEVSGGTGATPNVIKKNRMGSTGKGNGGNGLLVGGTGNGTPDPVEIEQNRAYSNGLNGISAVGSGHELKQNISGGSAAQKNGRCEFDVAAGNFSAGGNKANGVAVGGKDGEPFPTGCIGTP
jgi:hypothetical protein